MEYLRDFIRSSGRFTNDDRCLIWDCYFIHNEPLSLSFGSNLKSVTINEDQVKTVDVFVRFQIFTIGFRLNPGIESLVIVVFPGTVNIVRYHQSSYWNLLSL